MAERSDSSSECTVNAEFHILSKSSFINILPFDLIQQNQRAWQVSPDECLQQLITGEINADTPDPRHL
jgi:hypothetical protein